VQRRVVEHVRDEAEEAIADEVPEEVGPLRAPAREPRAEHDVGDAALDRLDQRRHVGGVVLHVGILDDGDVAVECGIAARIAAPLPRFGWRRRIRSGPALCQRVRMAPVSSVEPSSTAITCLSSSSAATRSSTSSIVAASLNAGTKNRDAH
jgi:hypothetical protein